MAKINLLKGDVVRIKSTGEFGICVDDERYPIVLSESGKIYILDAWKEFVKFIAVFSNFSYEFISVFRLEKDFNNGCFESYLKKIYIVYGLKNNSDKDNIFSLKLHQTIKLTEINVSVIRVPGGWVYEKLNKMIFIPYCDEFNTNKIDYVNEFDENEKKIFVAKNRIQFAEK